MYIIKTDREYNVYKKKLMLTETYTRINKYPAFCDNSVFGGGHFMSEGTSAKYL